MELIFLGAAMMLAGPGYIFVRSEYDMSHAKRGPQWFDLPIGFILIGFGVISLISGMSN